MRCGEVIGSFSDDEGEWVKVRCGQKDHNVMDGDPDLRKRVVKVITGHQLKQKQEKEEVQKQLVRTIRSKTANTKVFAMISSISSIKVFSNITFVDTKIYANAFSNPSKTKTYRENETYFELCVFWCLPFDV